MSQLYHLNGTRESIRLWCWDHAPSFLITQPIEIPSRLPHGSIVEMPFREIVARELREPTEKKYSVSFAMGSALFEIESCSEIDTEQAKKHAIFLADEIYSYQKTLPELLFRQLISRDFREQDRSLFILRTLRLDDPRILQQLIQFGQKKNITALIALSNYADQAESVCPVLVSAFLEEDYQHEYYSVAWMAERALVEVGPAAVPFLLKVARTNGPNIQTRALLTIVEILERNNDSVANSKCVDLLSFLDEQHLILEQEHKKTLLRISELCKRTLK